MHASSMPASMAFLHQHNTLIRAWSPQLQPPLTPLLWSGAVREALMGRRVVKVLHGHAPETRLQAADGPTQSHAHILT